MALTSGPFLALLSLVAVGTMAAAVLLWPRVAGRKSSHAAARTGLLIATQLTAIVAVLGGLNSYFSFIVSWSDLVGTHPSAASAVGQGTGHARRGPADRRHAHPDRSGRIRRAATAGRLIPPRRPPAAPRPLPPLQPRRTARS